MGALVNGHCFDTNALAADHWFSIQSDAFTAGSTSYHSWFEKVGVFWWIRREAISSNGVSTLLTSTQATVPNFPACTDSNFADGLTVGWGIATVMIMAWCYSKIRQAAR